MPAGGYRHAATNDSASAREPTIGQITPRDAEVEGAHQVGGMVPGGADERDGGVASIAVEEVGEMLERGVAVLEVDHDGVEAGGGDGRRGGGALEREPGGEGGLAGRPAIADRIGGHGGAS